MQTIKKLSERVSVTAQITPEDILSIRAAGFKGIICNRPDNEEAGQPAWHEIEAAARKAGLEARFAPLSGPVPTDDVLAEFDSAIDHIDGAILAYCRTGTRSEILWNASQSSVPATGQKTG